MTSISVIVPLLNEEKVLPSFLDHLEKFPVTEAICVDGGSRDRTTDILLQWSGSAGRFRRSVTMSSRGRALQMNEGAKRAAGEALLFLHSDCRLPVGALHAIAKVLEDAAVAGGAFRLKIDSSRLFLRGIAAAANLRSRWLSLPYGDQGYFVRRDIFEKIGGFKTLPIMEDVDFIRRLKQRGAIVLLDAPISTSARRWAAEGYLYATLRNFALLLLYFLRVAPEKLARWYDD
ncbi:MAG TPA: TIGR04283 family arsenosugar biosynthesis glycosyltransferase [Candidatus Manganitrophaceae bacterium]|nr:TIGR04283 family arsenosugar biosynthesis glycosyltransferase [Candidatus Manganitrophaceae bacterium]